MVRVGPVGARCGEPLQAANLRGSWQASRLTHAVTICPRRTIACSMYTHPYTAPAHGCVRTCVRKRFTRMLPHL